MNRTITRRRIIIMAIIMIVSIAWMVYTVVTGGTEWPN